MNTGIVPDGDASARSAFPGRERGVARRGGDSLAVTERVRAAHGDGRYLDHMRVPRPGLITFDVFGTILDWRRGTLEAVSRAGGVLPEGRFDEVVDVQARLERASPARPYREIVAESLVEVAGVPAAAAAEIGAAAGSWPLFPDSAAALGRLRRETVCGATTNSDRAHGEQVRHQLGFPLTYWWCAEEIGCYKPDPRVWEHAARAARMPFGRAWWHVSAYGDYDLSVARRLGLTTVYVERLHRRPGPADVVVPDLGALADLVERESGGVARR